MWSRVTCLTLNPCYHIYSIKGPYPYVLVHVKLCYDSVTNHAYDLSVLHSNSKDRSGLDGAQQSGKGAALAVYSHNCAEQVSQGRQDQRLSATRFLPSWLGIVVLWLIIPQSMGNFQIRCTFGPCLDSKRF